MKNYLKLLAIILFQNLKAQNLVISADANNIFYRGLDNPITVLANGVKANALIVKASNGEINYIHKNLYIYSPADNKEVEIAVYKIKLKDTILLGKKKFRIKNIEVEVYLKNKYNQIVINDNDSIHSDTIKNINKILANINMPYGTLCEFKPIVLSYSILIVRKDEVIVNKQYFTNSINDELHAIFNDLKIGDYLIFNQIKLSHSTINVKPIEFRIK